ncbi:MAG: entericidin A/B family lipoprotein [Alphaproteobacteria bacterium]|nr:entericidin A/B family lipoprotein [Alphaproteobacteria bacterium]MCB9931642.1 entericidin A/B family lipoprotein [Alphaproteobacteria bacterium]
MRTLMGFLLIAAAGSWLTACNTAEGVGKDVKATGNAIEETAKDVKKKL